MIKRITILMVVAIASVMMCAAADKPAANIELQERSHDFGLVKEDGGAVSHEFTFTNTGDAPLVIISATASCGCTRPTYTQQPVKPGKKGTIKVTYLPKGRPGEFDKTVKVRTNDPHHRKVTLKISGSVVPSGK